MMGTYIFSKFAFSLHQNVTELARGETPRQIELRKVECFSLKLHSSQMIVIKYKFAGSNANIL